MKLLKFGKGNAKLGKKVFTFSLPAGWTCPNANECLSKSNRETGKITDGKVMRFRCFAASMEAVFPNVRAARWHNFELLKKLSYFQMVELIQDSLPKKADIVRIHVSGDFFNCDYFAAWKQVAENNPKVIFYFYTKMVSYIVKYLSYIPKNFIYTISKGGKQDNLIALYNLRFTQVVYSEKEAKDLNLDIDHDDSHAMIQGRSFGLLIHGQQKAESFASKAKSALKGLGAYPSKKISLSIV